MASSPQSRPVALLIALALSVLASGAQGQTFSEPLSFQTRTGQRFEQAVVTDFTPYKIIVRVGSTHKTVRLVDLPESLQKRFAALAFAPLPPKIGDTLDITTRQGTVLKKAILQRIEPNGLTVETEEGLLKIAYPDLPEHLGSYFEFDPEEVARFEAVQRTAATDHARRVQAALAAERTAKTKADAAAAAQARKATPTPANRGEVGMGERGKQNLGAPRLGGSGINK